MILSDRSTTRTFFRWALLVATAGLLAEDAARAQDRIAQIMSPIQFVAASLADANGPGAMTPFDKSTPGYDKLASYFEALTDQARVHSDVEVIEENGSDNESRISVRWTLFICALVTGEVLETRVQEVRIRLVPAQSRKFRWKIVSFEPIELFNPTLGKR